MPAFNDSLLATHGENHVGYASRKVQDALEFLAIIIVVVRRRGKKGGMAFRLVEYRTECAYGRRGGSEIVACCAGCREATR